MTRAQPLRVHTDVYSVDSLKGAVDPEYSQSFSKLNCFVSYNARFDRDVLGAAPELVLVSARYGDQHNFQKRDQFAHEAGVYIRSTNSIYFTSNFQTSDPEVHLYSIDAGTWMITKHDYDDVHCANGACHWQDKLLYCVQGNHEHPSALVAVDPKTSKSETILNNFYGRLFSSINDVVVHYHTGDIWFTDPIYGYMQGFRPTPELPKQVYRFNPKTGVVAVVADGFDQCNGLCFSPDFSKLYVTDTGAVGAHHGVKDGHNFSFDGRRAASIYVYDVLEHGTRLGPRRFFAFCANGVPDGIKCDDRGNVYSGCGDGVHVWDPQGTLIGKIVTSREVANFCFARDGMWMFAEEELYWVKLKARGALAGIECEGLPVHTSVMADGERRSRSRFDQAEPRKSRFDRRSRSPTERKPEDGRERSPIARDSREPRLEGSKSPANDPAAAA
ncbi:hypothetical protein KEM54_006497, partial [Ascosphaera aggregata]